METAHGSSPDSTPSWRPPLLPSRPLHLNDGIPGCDHLRPLATTRGHFQLLLPELPSPCALVPSCSPTHAPIHLGHRARSHNVPKMPPLFFVPAPREQPATAFSDFGTRTQTDGSEGLSMGSVSDSQPALGQSQRSCSLRRSQVKLVVQLIRIGLPSRLGPDLRLRFRKTRKNLRSTLHESSSPQRCNNTDNSLQSVGCIHGGFICFRLPSSGSLLAPDPVAGSKSRQALGFCRSC
jgi:hypothetical protein